MPKKVYLLGCGMGKEELLTAHAQKLLRESDCIVTTPRLANALALPPEKTLVKKTGEIADFLTAGVYRSACVLASGDVGFYSIASTLQHALGDTVELEWVSGISSLQYLTAACGIGYEQVKLVSLHGKTESPVPFVTYHKQVFFLTGGAQKAAGLLTDLREAGLGSVSVIAGERLGSTDERILRGTPDSLRAEVFDDLTVLLVQNDRAADSQTRLKDTDFVRGKIPMSKECVRSVAASMLDIRKTDTVYDVGAGTGAMTLTLAQKAHDRMVFALEREEAGIALIRENMQKQGICNVVLRQGEAPDGLAEFPAPDKVFIGGSGGRLQGIVSLVFEKNPCAEVLVTAVTLETLTEAVSLFSAFGLETETVCLNVSQAAPLGNYQLMKAENPVYLIKGVKRDA